MSKEKKKKDLIKILHETVKISRKKGNGLLKFLANADSKGNLISYSLTYINLNIFNEDNGRVVGYDNEHGYHHRHYMGKIERIHFSSFEKIKELFEEDWRKIHEKNNK